ncbi:MAG: glycosyltransferase family 92 protein [Anaerolineaceae bacterium]|nr:glycosyltransferase family 92 protein [Anaerolineaceae bacterium]
MDTIALCLIARDEAEYLVEWIDYHILIGVERFYIYDNESKIPIRQTLATYIETDWVHVQEIEGHSQQLYVYDHCLKHFGKDTKWIGFIDADEFIVLKDTLNIKDFLSRYEKFGGLAISSLFFGSNGAKRKPKEGQIKAFTYRTAGYFHENRLVKSIVQPSKVEFPDSPHGFTYKSGYYCVNEAGFVVASQMIPNSIKSIQLNHYICRSEEDLNEKMNRGVGGAGRPYLLDRFEKVDKLSNVEDTEIQECAKRIFYIIDEGNIFNEIKNKSNNSILDFKNALFAYSQLITPSVKKIEYLETITVREEYVEHRQEINEMNQAIEENNFHQAKECIDRLIEQFPDRFSFYCRFANYCLLNPQNYSLAWDYLWKAWEKRPQIFEVMKEMANFFVLTKDYPQAEKIFLLMIKQGPNEIDTRFRLAWVFLQQGKSDFALTYGYPVLFNHPIENELPKAMLLEMLQKFSKYLIAARNFEKAHIVLNLGAKWFPGDQVMESFRENLS